MLVLATDTNGEQLWTSAAHTVIVTRGGRIVRTVGLEHDVSGVTPKTGQQLPDVAAALNHAERLIRELKENGDYNDPNLMVIVRDGMKQVVLSIPFLAASA